MKLKLIDEWRNLHKFASVRLAALAAVVAGYLAANPDKTQELLALLPDGPARVAASTLVGLFVFSLAAGTRALKADKGE